MTIQLIADEVGHLTLIDEQGTRHVDVTAVRAFPLTSPGGWIAIRGPLGQELALVDDPAQLPPEVRALLERDLRERSYSPIVERIVRITRGDDGTHWEVDTDRGRAEFRLETEDSIRGVGTNGAVIVDADGVRYRIPDLSSLDRTSRRMFERFY